MNFYEVSPAGIVGRDFSVLAYACDRILPAGTIVEIPVGSRKFVGVISRQVAKPSFAVKEILRVLFERPIPSQLLTLHAWIGDYYATHPGVVWRTMLPAGLNKKRREKNHETRINSSINRTNFVFNNDQTRAISELSRDKTGTAILHGITGSGKTAVYIELAKRAAADGKSSIILVPEIALTTQLVDDFREIFPKIICTHSTMSEAERAEAWLDALTSKQPIVIIGPRSALFMPVHDLGLIVIDECHEPSYFQEQAPRYNALRVAAKLSEIAGAKLVLGSATPAISDVFIAKKLGRPIVEMRELARPNAIRPETAIVDLTKRDNFSSASRIFSRQLLSAVKDALDAKKQVLLFHNRRGSASTTLCENCGWIATCPRCFLPLTLHADKFELRCHICGFREKPPTKCPECGHAEIIHKGIGTKRIEEEMRQLFPDKTIRRFDGDTARGENVADIFAKLRDGSTDVIIGTQQIAKGLDLPNLQLVGIVQADTGLALPDFAASERVFQLIAQAAGRVGRGAEASRVIIQTFQPNAPAVIFGAAQDYENFYAHEIRERKRGHFPPFAYLLKLTCQYKTEKGATSAAAKLVREIGVKFGEKIKILGPAPAFYERARDKYRWQIVVRAANREILKQIASEIPPKVWQAELDPNSLI